jgi:chloramphenicol O-acetyltransferase type A
MQRWSRSEHFKFYGAFNHPHFGMCANVDLKRLYPYIKQEGISFTASIVYLISRAANAIPEFRYRIRDEKVVEHEVVHPSITVLTEGDLFSFCKIEYGENFLEFADRAKKEIAYVKEYPMLKDKPGEDDLMFMTAIPWVSFTSFMHPINLHPADSVPRFAWGKFFPDGESLNMPLGVQAHHALMDGIHMGRFYEALQDFLDYPDNFLGKVSVEL